MSLPLGVLDQSPIVSGHVPAEAVAETVQLAALADRLGYARYWLAEHHAIAALADPAPEILAAHVAGATRRIRVGTGGVLLPHYSALKVAEQFRLVFELPDYLRDLYKLFGNSLDRFHDEPRYRLPVPARYVIDSKGIIRAADVNADYTNRTDPSETLKLLRTLSP